MDITGTVADPVSSWKNELRTASVDLGSVRVNIVGLDHSLGSQYFGTLIVSEGGLTADINHGGNTVGVTNDTSGSIKGLGTF